MKVLVWLALLAFGVPVAADVSINNLSSVGSLTVDELVEASPGVWRIEVTAVTFPGISFQVLADEDDEIEYIKVRGRVDPLFPRVL